MELFLLRKAELLEKEVKVFAMVVIQVEKEVDIHNIHIREGIMKAHLLEVIVIILPTELIKDRQPQQTLKEIHELVVKMVHGHHRQENHIRQELTQEHMLEVVGMTAVEITLVENMEDMILLEVM